ncbi:hypothetical protein U1Q18_037811 [Sarracenia purpurea var. burkii]
MFRGLSLRRTRPSELSNYEENEEGDQNVPPALVHFDSRVSSKVSSDLGKLARNCDFDCLISEGICCGDMEFGRRARVFGYSLMLDDEARIFLRFLSVRSC